MPMIVEETQRGVMFPNTQLQFSNATSAPLAVKSVAEENRPRKRRNLCLCEQVKCKAEAAKCREAEDAAGEMHWLYGSMYQIPGPENERCGVNMRRQWMRALGINEDALTEKGLTKPELRWTHFPEDSFKNDSQLLGGAAKRRRRRLKYTISPPEGTPSDAIIAQGKHKGRTIPVPSVTFEDFNLKKHVKIEAPKTFPIVPSPSMGPTIPTNPTDLQRIVQGDSSGRLVLGNQNILFPFPQLPQFVLGNTLQTQQQQQQQQQQQMLLHQHQQQQEMQGRTMQLQLAALQTEVNQLRTQLDYERRQNAATVANLKTQLRLAQAQQAPDAEPASLQQK